MSRHLDKLPLLDGFYLLRQFLISQNHQDTSIENRNNSILHNSAERSCTVIDQRKFTKPNETDVGTMDKKNRYVFTLIQKCDFIDFWCIHMQLQERIVPKI